MSAPRPSRWRAGPPSETEAQPLDRGFIITIIAAAGVVIFLYMVRQILLPFVAAGMAAIVFTPLVTWGARRSGLPRALCAVVVFLVLAGLGAAVGSLIGPPIARRVGGVIADLPRIVQSLVGGLLGGRTIEVAGQPLGAQQLSAAILQQLGGMAQPSGLASTAGAGVAGATYFILSWVLLCYFLISGPRLAAGLAWMAPPPHRALASEIWRRLERVLRRYFIGIGLVVVYASIAAYLGLGFALRLHDALLLAVMTGLLEIVPVAGPITSAVIAGVAAVGEAKSGTAILAYLAYAILLRLSIDQFVGPLVLGRAARLHPTLVIFCFLAGALLFGITGVIMAVPVALAVKVTLATLYGEEDPHAAARALEADA
ncbi:MAG TPA: AI-2E family transporter [Caulobacteraceae bacterium]|nr:AI-2E family transporter [Caulobacteraceae bacterium]